jgi:hypothetical protein
MFINKKGQQNTIAVTIAIVLGIALIVFLIWGFSTNWTLFTKTGSSYVGDDVTIAKQACAQQCEAGLKIPFCEGTKSVTNSTGSKLNVDCRKPPINSKCPNLC